MFWGLLFTIITGVLFLIGIVLLKNNKYKELTSNFTTSLALVVLIGLIIFDLLPELLEANNKYLFLPIIFGFVILVLLDKLIPHHHHDHTDKKCDHHDHELHLNHIGIVTIIALAIHNMIEGLSLYNVTLLNIKSGILMMLGVSLHNIPLGFQIGNSLNEDKNNKLLIFLLCISSFLGALIIILFGNLHDNIIYLLLSITLGMILYITIFELLEETIKYIKKKETLYGIITGIIIVIVIRCIS